VGVIMPSDRETGRPRGFAFVEFASEEAAAEAVRRFGNLELGGRRLRISLAEDRPPRRDGPPPPRTYGAPPPDMGRGGFGGGDPFGGGGGGFGGGGGGFGANRPPFDGRRAKGKGSRRGLRRRKRSL
jgi:RNA recognition motif-containing protein